MYVTLTINIERVDNGLIYNCVTESGDFTVNAETEYKVTKVVSGEPEDNYTLRSFVTDSFEKAVKLFNKPKLEEEILAELELVASPEIKPEDDIPF